MNVEPEVTQGSIETLYVDLEDISGNLSTLVGASCTFDVKERDLVTIKMNDVAITTDIAKPMRAGCVINTLLGGLWEAGKYALYLTFSNNPDTPVIGPLYFQVNP